jgi:hypothetical protein
MTALAIPDPVLVEHDGYVVLRDDLVDGGTKIRVAVDCLLSEPDIDEWVFAGPSQGYAQLALAIGCEAIGRRATFFTAKRKQRTYITEAALDHGLQLHEVDYGRLNVVRKRARDYIAETPGCSPLIPMGLHLPGMKDRMAAMVASLPIEPTEVWVACGSGLLASSIQQAWPNADVNAVVCGMTPTEPDRRLILWDAPEDFSQDARGPLPPYPSVRNYDAKIWRFVTEHATPGALVWNVGR